MRLKNNFIIAIYAIGLGVSLFLGSVREARGFNESDLLDRQIKATNMKDKSIDQVLDLLAVEYGVPVGIELGDPKLIPRREIELKLPKTNLKSFLDTLIAKDSRYTWKLDGGVIHLLPVTARDTFITTLLDVRISHFATTGGVTRYRIFNDIMSLPEISSQLVIAGVEPMIFINFGNMHRLEKGVFFSESNLTLRELLDKIVLKTEIKRWVITRWGDNNEYITLRS